MLTIISNGMVLFSGIVSYPKCEKQDENKAADFNAFLTVTGDINNPSKYSL